MVQRWCRWLQGCHRSRTRPFRRQHEVAFDGCRVDGPTRGTYFAARGSPLPMAIDLWVVEGQPRTYRKIVQPEEHGRLSFPGFAPVDVEVRSTDRAATTVTCSPPTVSLQPPTAWVAGRVRSPTPLTAPAQVVGCGGATTTALDGTFRMAVAAAGRCRVFAGPEWSLDGTGGRFAVDQFLEVDPVDGTEVWAEPSTSPVGFAGFDVALVPETGAVTISASGTPGTRRGDVVGAVDGEQVTGPEGVAKVFAALAVRNVDHHLTVIRDGAPLDVQFSIRSR
ncbi:MAG: hypothetical protein ABMB14_36500 [Myxococcota bacterium]